METYIKKSELIHFLREEKHTFSRFASITDDPTMRRDYCLVANAISVLIREIKVNL